MTMQKNHRKHLTVDDYVEGVLSGDRVMLARTITLIESSAKKHRDLAEEILKRLMPHTGNSIRVGITGVPGAGKSTLIETFGSMLCEDGHKVAVLAIDPSSSVTGGSILGDKTRMEKLARNPKAFVRPSPSGGTLGGVNRKTRETMLVCEAAGFDVILIETVGTGQNEVTVRSMVDFFLVIALTGAGDELQGMKKGVMELADAIFINKADGENKKRAMQARAEYNRILYFLQSPTEGWKPKAYTCSALTGENIREIWDVIKHFEEVTKDSGVFEKRRQEQMIEWFDWMIEDELKRRFFENEIVKDQLPSIRSDILEAKISPTMAVKKIMELYDQYR